MADKITFSDQVLDPEVIADMVSAKLTAGLKFTPLAQVDTTLVGKPGSTVEFPSWNYIGDAVDLQEGVAIETKDLTYGSKAATIKEFGTAIAITDQAMMTGYGDPWGEATNQLALAMNNKLDNDILATLKEAPQKQTVDLTLDGLQDALDVYNDEDDNSSIVLIVSPKAAGRLRLQAGKDWLRGSELGAEVVSKGVYGEILGVQIIRSKKLVANEGILVKTNTDDGKPAVKLMVKRDVNIEAERLPKLRETKLYANAFEAPYLFDPTKVVNLTFNGITGQDATTGAPTATTVDNKVTNVKEDNRIGKGRKKGTVPGEV
ncbi:N4-gp56 family major capsid protein [Ligilactobacillus saerimneri]|uniref:N4-gp56 family major capsid protein n=1 Tax=Ligilactobacillus saerimneri TaxID=228229 RepID=UPI0024B953C2|nr:N4-gp56 family major capsid protein [Ligilactobacillus saerimneri]